MSDRAGGADLAVIFPPRLALFGPPQGPAFRIPALVMGLLQAPLVVSALFLSLHGAILLFYGFGFPDGAPLWWGLAKLSAPGVVVDLFYLFGRVEWVASLPDPRRLDAPPPAVLTVPESSGAMRPADPAPKVPAGRRPADGVLFASGVGALTAALAIALLQTETFDAVLGIKLGGVQFRGEYWNRWWFVFYGLLGGGLASLGGSLTLFLRRLNRKDD